MNQTIQEIHYNLLSFRTTKWYLIYQILQLLLSITILIIAYFQQQHFRSSIVFILQFILLLSITIDLFIIRACTQNLYKKTNICDIIIWFIFTITLIILLSLNTKNISQVLQIDDILIICIVIIRYQYNYLDILLYLLEWLSLLKRLIKPSICKNKLIKSILINQIKVVLIKLIMMKLLVPKSQKNILLIINQNSLIKKINNKTINQNIFRTYKHDPTQLMIIYINLQQQYRGIIQNIHVNLVCYFDNISMKQNSTLKEEEYKQKDNNHNSMNYSCQDKHVQKEIEGNIESDYENKQQQLEQDQQSQQQQNSSQQEQQEQSQQQSPQQNIQDKNIQMGSKQHPLSLKIFRTISTISLALISIILLILSIIQYINTHSLTISYNTQFSLSILIFTIIYICFCIITIISLYKQWILIIRIYTISNIIINTLICIILITILTTMTHYQTNQSCFNSNFLIAKLRQLSQTASRIYCSQQCPCSSTSSNITYSTVQQCPGWQEYFSASDQIYISVLIELEYNFHCSGWCDPIPYPIFTQGNGISYNKTCYRAMNEYLLKQKQKLLYIGISIGILIYLTGLIIHGYLFYLEQIQHYLQPIQ